MHEDADALGILPGTVDHFGQNRVDKTGQRLKVPHMGWNSITNLKSNLFSAETESQHVYFVHSYFAGLGEHTAATCTYILPFSAALQKDNFYATQFHPEKSGSVGAKILENFINL